MKNVIFDVDDTLYDLMEAFDKVHKEFFEDKTKEDCEELFKRSRIYSDEAFYMAREGKSVTTMNLHTAFRRLIKTLGLK